ncbi:HlyD family type I secretion periplasmic adaptor subunit [Bradyrhizobium sp. ARR65]|uniref:HlyD family type I secretion periplasmic adaptor subunit n=1 Tax=Bradyrhizobium sp. ARR65 TaxID=1040989 RepID=UPI000466C50C|nr:HlyD family type I secretion periplasmic adaptor subunit [Bradyrhizobium sp. ARR65]
MSNTDAVAVVRSVRVHLALGILGVLAFIACVGGWATATELAGAVVANGTFVVESYVKTIQHPTGGVVGELLVHEGQRVKAGGVLIRLDATQVKANLAIVTKRLNELTAREARLEAERDDKDAITFPPALLAHVNEPEVTRAMQGEQHLFQSRRDTRISKKAQLAERIKEYQNQIAGLKAQQLAFEQGIEVRQREIVNLRDLLAKGITSVQRLNELERDKATLDAYRGQVVAGQALAAGAVDEARLQSLQIDQDLKTEVASDLRDTQAQIGEFSERKIAAEDQLRRIDMIAPQDGVVHNLSVHTLGAVISPGETAMEIVPDEDSLALEAHINPQDIHDVQLGQPAVLRLTAFNLRTTPELNGTVRRVGADVTQDQRTGASYYVIRITIAPEELARLGQLKLVPGMPAEAQVQTGERTALSYLMKPLRDQIARAFRED